MIDRSCTHTVRLTHKLDELQTQLTHLVFSQSVDQHFVYVGRWLDEHVQQMSDRCRLYAFDRQDAQSDWLNMYIHTNTGATHFRRNNILIILIIPSVCDVSTHLSNQTHTDTWSTYTVYFLFLVMLISVPSKTGPAWPQLRPAPSSICWWAAR